MLGIYCFLDAETLPPVLSDSELAEFKLSIKPQGNVKDPEKIAKFQEDNYLEKYAELGKDVNYADIFSLAYSFDKNEVNEESVTVLYEEGRTDEKELLIAFYDDIKNSVKERLGDFNGASIDSLAFSVYFVGFNLRSFDLEILWRKAVKYGLYDLAKLIPRTKYDKRVIDLKEIFNGASNKIFTSQDFVCKYFGIQGKPDDIDGSQVFSNFQEGNYKKIAKYNASDVITVIRLFKLMGLDEEGIG